MPFWKSPPEVIIWAPSKRNLFKSVILHLHQMLQDLIGSNKKFDWRTVRFEFGKKRMILKKWVVAFSYIHFI